MKINGSIRFLGLLLVFSVSKYAVGLECCVDHHETVVKVSTDSDQIVGNPCRNRGKSCETINCPTNTCTEDLPYIRGNETTTDTTCKKKETCNPSWKKPTCRILYYEKVVDQNEHSDDDDDTGPDLEIQYYAEQSCFDNSYGDIENMGCQFHNTIFYLDRRLRITYFTECFCMEDTCNEDITQLCLSTTLNVNSEKDTMKCGNTAGYKHLSGAGMWTTCITVLLSLWSKH